MWSRLQGQRVLELGVGTGKNIPFYPAGAEVTATDISERMLERAARRAEKLRVSVHFEIADAQQLSYASGSFDCVVATFLFCSVPDPGLGLAEARRVLKPGGVFVLTFSNRCFPNKAVSVWLSTTDQQHIELVTQYFEESGNWRGINSAQKFAKPPEKGGDPLYAVWAIKTGDS